ncbi:hypothetical protein [Haloferula sp. BvORR071]|uniref:HNH endonuclease n=1 Tax=Haloferula sp. BvORR071 TaxID=1396141 RepID=UPI002240FB3A|nr:hypothetical protein [Haloferula sp. BvORR071]
MVESDAKDYFAKARGADLYQLVGYDPVGMVSGEEMVGVYTLRMVPKKSKGRPIYDRIMTTPAHSRCPMCGIGTVNTLDHYLPKTHYPVYAVAPDNLVAACKWCQGEKSEYFPANKAGQLLHPYFDDFDGEIWLVAEVIVGSPVAFRFFAAPPSHWSGDDQARTASHLKELNLPTLFASNAGSRLAEIRGRLTGLFKLGGKSVVRDHLKEELVSIEADHRNSWVAAMYRAAVASDWFCDGGFIPT